MNLWKTIKNTLERKVYVVPLFHTGKGDTIISIEDATQDEMARFRVLWELYPKGERSVIVNRPVQIHVLNGPKKRRVR